jgi:hypothetical protein
MIGFCHSDYYRFGDISLFNHTTRNRTFYRYYDNIADTGISSSGSSGNAYAHYLSGAGIISYL